MANFDNTIVVTGPISPIDERDKYPTHFARLGKGGFYQVATLSDRNLISQDRRELGLTVLVTNDLNPDNNRAYTLYGGLTNNDWEEWVVTPNYLEDWKNNSTFPTNPNIYCNTITTSGDGTFNNVLVYNSVRLGNFNHRLQVVPSGVHWMSNDLIRLTVTNDGKLVTYPTYVPTEAKSLVTKDFVEQLIGSGGGGSPSDIPNTPTNLTPINEAINQGTNNASITFTASVYFSPISSAMVASQWRFSLLSDFSTLLFTTGDRAGTSTSYTLTNPITVLGAGSTVYWQVRYKDATGDYSNWSTPTTFSTTSVDPPPTTPTNISPANNATNIGDRGAAVTLQGSAYNSAVNSAMTAAEFQITTSADNGFANPVVNTGPLLQTLVSYTLPNPSSVLSVNTTYRWRVRYRDSAGLYSSWSSSTVFTTSSSFSLLPPFTPINEAPVNGAVNEGVNATEIILKATQYNSPEASPMQGSQWQVAPTADLTFSNPVVDTGLVSGTSIIRTITSPASYFQPNTTYRWRVRYQDSNGLNSGWSNATTFTTASSFALLVAPQPPSNVAPANLAVNQGYNQAAIVLQGSPYQHTNNVPMGGRQFQLTSSADTGFTDLILNTNELSGTDLTYSISDPSVLLATNTTYRWRVRYKSNQGVWSAWSTSTRFTTGSTFSNDFPIIVTQPSSILVNLGNTATFFISALGSNLTYQWFKNNVSITGATSPIYSFPALSNSPGGYSCKVQNTAGEVTSATATLTLTTIAPTIVQEPSDLAVSSGQTAVFTVVANGTPPLDYQWRRNNVNIAGAASASYTITNVSVGDSNNYSCIISNSAGSVTTRSAILTVTAQAPTITSQPQNLSINSGSTAQFSVIVTGTPTLTYQWRKDGVPISGATAATYTKSNATSADAGSYSVVITNSAGSVTSAAATLTVSTAPVIVQQPLSLSIAEGQLAIFNVVATGSSPLTYQWKRNGVDIPGATSSIYQVLASNSSVGNYTVVVTNSVSSVTSSTAALTLQVLAPQIISQPTDVTAFEKQQALFQVVATGTALNYQWQRNGVNIAGATQSVYQVNVWSGSAGSYTVVVSNSAGSVTSSPAQLTLQITAPAIIQHPQNIIVSSGQAAFFSVSATGTDVSFQWRRNGVNISGATSFVYSISNTTTSFEGSYTVVVSNSAGSVTSDPATLTVTAATPTITSPPQSVTVNEGNTATFNVTATGSPPLSYVWRKDNVVISGANNNIYTIPNVSNSNVGAYTVTVSNNAGSVVSTAATLNVNSAPVIGTLQSLTVNQGNSVTFSIPVNDGSGPFTYQWYRRTGGGSFVVISGATSSSYTIASADVIAHASDYYVTVTNSVSTATSNTASLTVVVPAPVIVSQPQSLTVIEGQPASFSVTVSGTGPFSFQWRKNSVNISGATSSTYTISNTAAADAANYSVAVTGSGGSSVISSSASLTIQTAPVITTQPSPSSITLEQGGQLSLSVGASGTAPLSYQWRRNGTNIVGSTNSTYFETVTTSTAGTYNVVVTNSAGSVTSNNVTVTVLGAPVTLLSPTQALTTTVGSSITLTSTTGTVASATNWVITRGDAPLTYQWRKDGVNISGATSATYTISNADTTDTGSYSLVVTNSRGSATATQTLTVNVPLAIITQPNPLKIEYFANEQNGVVEFVYSAPSQQPVLWYAAAYNNPSFTGTPGSASLPNYDVSQISLGNGQYKTSLTPKFNQVLGTFTSNVTNFKARVGTTTVFEETTAAKVLGIDFIPGFGLGGSIAGGGATQIRYIRFNVPNTFSEVGPLTVNMTVSVSSPVGMYVRAATAGEMTVGDSKFSVGSSGSFTVPANNTFVFAYFVLDGVVSSGISRVTVNIQTNYGTASGTVTVEAGTTGITPATPWI